jgi:N-acetylmuramoyl-L-alanine amidase
VAQWGRFQTGLNEGMEVSTPVGRLRLTAGTQQAQWNGLTFWLGYPPVASNGLFLVHPVDLGKNLGPLVESGTAPEPTNRVVVIDPGHGGINAGTRSILGNRFEKDYTLDWALRLQPLLETNGWTVVLTRTNDVDLSLADRVAVADRVQAALFISLHFNSAFPRQDQTGLETFCLTPAGLPSTLTRDFEDDPARVFPNNEFDAPNLRLALAVHRALLEVSGTTDRGVKRARFMGVLRTQSRPAILVEGGYLSNPEEAARIARPEHRQQLAEAVSRALPGSNVETLAAALAP